MIRRVAFLLAWCTSATGAAAQVLPSEPVTFGHGRAVLSGDVSVSFSPEDLGFFNYSDYEHSTLRTLRLGVSGLFRIADRVSVLGELRSENLDDVRPVALYVRVRPLPGRRLDIQAGRIPPAFGLLSRQTYSRDAPLIGSPLAYQYLTSLRADALPADLDELLTMRGRGWLANYSVGERAPARGVPLASSFTWDTGVQVTSGWGIVEATGAITTGTLSRPRVSDDNGGKQIAARVTVSPAAGLTLGTSMAHGPFVSRRAAAASGLGGNDRYAQTAHGLDAEYSRGHLVARADAVFSAWRIPLAGVRRAQTLRAAAVAVETRYMFLPGAYAAVRAEHLTFSRVAATTRSDTWDAAVNRLEVGGGYYLRRNVVGRASLQLNRRDGGHVRRSELLAGQLLFWF
jgi:hypothetical protein